jgi:hypothetical protein
VACSVVLETLARPLSLVLSSPFLQRPSACTWTLPHIFAAMLPLNLSLLVLTLLTHEASAQRLKPTGVFRIPPPKASPHLALAADNPPTPVAAFTVPSSLPSCLPNSYSASNLNEIIAAKGPNFTLSLCPNMTYMLETTLILTALGQEISTLGYPEGSERAMLVVDGNTNTTNGMTTAISAINFDALKIRNIQIDGNRGSSGPYMGGANVELGGPARGQVRRLSLLHCFQLDPRRAWTLTLVHSPSFLNRSSTVYARSTLAAGVVCISPR